MRAHPHALDEVPCHDPYVLAVEDGYLLYTSFDSRRWAHHIPDGSDYAAPVGTGVLAWWSPDLRTWGSPEVVFTVPDGAWASPDAAPWAPEVHAWGDRFVLATTLHAPHDPLPPTRQRGTVVDLIGAAGEHTLRPIRRGTVLAVADDPRGPFELLDPSAPHTPGDFMALDGTLVRDEHGAPWLVYAHEWVQVLDGTMEAVPLTEELAVAGAPVHLFRASEAPWFTAITPSTQALAPYVTDGPQPYRLPGGALAVLWASYRPGSDVVTGEYVETQAISPSGSLLGPWQQGEVLVAGNAGHGMLLTTHDGELVLVLHRGMNTPRVRAEVHDVVATPTGLRVVGRRVPAM
ncbi:MAG TPA: glycoside hydrolase [Micrococcales bacterium]|uniref:family 43 glycosylhydrolase n=1 Tax=Miniimonas arenae TaxID=676201 RepID=UPI000EC2B622|nr:family 43 glycosylhydrolase [Miniimonas arenae]HCX86141.1 glycoside hydrolase [Micrococcales bacterium]